MIIVILIISLISEIHGHSLIPSIPNDPWKSPQENPRTSFLRHQLIYYKKHDSQDLGLRCQIPHGFPVTRASHCLSLFLGLLLCEVDQIIL